MSYVLTIIATMMFSFVGILVKTSIQMVNGFHVTFCRFAFGFLFLLLVCLISRKKPQLFIKNKWIWLAILGKSINYLCENTALSMGLVSGSIIGYPTQAIALAVFSAIFFKEHIGLQKAAAMVLCVIGVVIVSLKGNDLSTFFAADALTTILYIVSSIASAMFVLCQKKLVDTVEPIEMNLTVFLFSSIIVSFPAGAGISEIGSFRWDSMLALIRLGCITGGGFLLLAKSLKKISLVASGMIQSASSILVLIWSALFFQEKITSSLIIGTIIFLIGMTVLNMKFKRKNS